MAALRSRAGGNTMKTEKRRNITGKALAILLAFAVAFTGMPAFAGGLDAHAASPYFRSFSAKATGQTGVKLTWKKLTSKQKKKISGIAVYRNGKLIRHISKKRTSYADNGLKAGTKYRYQVKTYRIKKVKQWYNKKTGKWQKKKPAKMYRGKSRKKKTLVYSNASGKKIVTTAQAVSGDDNDGSTVLDGGDNGGDNGGSGGGNSGDENLSEYDRLTGATLSCTDYLGKTHTSYETASGYWTRFSWEGSGNKPSQQLTQKADIIESINSPYYNRTVDGEFTISGKTMIQKGGVTFHIPADPASDGNTNRAMYVYMYNGDINKLDMSLEVGTIDIPTYTYEQEPITRKYVMKGKYRLSEVYPARESTRNEHYCECTDQLKIKSMSFNDLSCGFVSGNINIRVSYDFNGNGKYENNEYIGTSVYKVDADPARAEALRIATLATAETDGYDADMKAIKAYLLANYQESDTFEGVPMSCVGGAYILETWSIEKYGIYGFGSYGSCPPGTPNYGSHVAFYPEANALSGKEYYEARGKRKGD